VIDNISSINSCLSLREASELSKIMGWKKVPSKDSILFLYLILYTIYLILLADQETWYVIHLFLNNFMNELISI